MNQQQLQAILNGVLEQNGLNLQQLLTNIQQAQQNIFLQMVNKNGDICASSQLDIERTNLLQHEINTGIHAPVTK